MFKDANSLRELLKEIIMSNLERDEKQINWESNQIYCDLAIDSLEAMKIIVEIENQFHIEIPDEDLQIDILDSLEKLENRILDLGGIIDARDLRMEC